MKEAVIRKKAIEILLCKKWVYWYAPKVKFQQTDIFGVFDMVCWKRTEKKLKFIQLTTYSNLSARRKKIQSFFQTNKIKPKAADVEIWAWNNNKKEFKVEII